jgi:hypothetical protein
MSEEEERNTRPDDNLLIFTIGSRAREVILDSPSARAWRAGEGLLDGAARAAMEFDLQTVTFASVVVDARDLTRPSWMADLVALLRNRLFLAPLIVMDVPEALDSEWPLARLVALSRGLRAPVVRAASVEVPAWELAALFSEWLMPGYTCSDPRDVQTTFAPACGGAVVRWSPWNGDEARPLPARLADALRNESLAAVFVTYRFAPSATLHRIDATMARIAAAAHVDADVLFASPIIEGEEEVLVTIVHADRR